MNESTVTAEKPPISWLAYVFPMILFVTLTFLEGSIPKPQYVAFYAFKAIAVTIALIVFRKTWTEIRIDGKLLPIALAVGIAVFAEWVLITKYIPYPMFGSRVAFDPVAAFPDASSRAMFLALRFYGLVIMVPLMEEIFWRSFFLRWITNAEYHKLAIGDYSPTAFCIVAAMFGLAHPEWLVAVICAAAYALLLRKTRSLFACVVAHATTNLALGIYVLMTQDWRFW